MLNEVYLNQGSCEMCYHKFLNGDFLYLFKEDGMQCCSTCANDLAIERYDDYDDEPFDFYLVDNNVGRLILDCVSFPELKYGYYQLKKINDRFIVTATLKSLHFGKTYYNEANEDTFFLIKEESLVSLLFPKQMKLDKYEFINNPDVYNDEISQLQSFTDTSELMFICDGNDNVVGISSDKSHHSIFKRIVPPSLNNLDLYLVNSEKLADECKNMPIDRKTAKQLETFSPEEMLKYCEDRIHGQGNELKKAVYLVYQYLQNVAKCKPFRAHNWMLTGISGSGKTEFFRTIRDFFEEYDIPVPVVQIDLSNITETGYKGADADTIPQRIQDKNPLTNGIGICFLDEADKKCIASYGSHDTDCNAALQANILTMIEGSVFPAKDDVHEFNSELTMFILMGAFQELRNQKRDAVKAGKKVKSIGFGGDFDMSDESNTSEDFSDDIQYKLTLEEIIDFGLMEELAGRLVQVINWRRLSEEDMLKLIKCKAKEISQTSDIKIEITDKATEEFLSISYGDMGVRAPMNRISELAMTTISEVFFYNGFEPTKDKVIIDSLNSAHIERTKPSQGESR